MTLLVKFCETFICSEHAWLNVLCCCLCYQKSKSEAKKAKRSLENRRKNNKNSIVEKRGHVTSPEAIHIMTPASGII